MEMQPVSSSDIASIGYDNESAILRIEYLKSGSYDYHGVPADIFDGLVSAASKGRYVNEFIKKGGYPFSKL